MANKKLLDDFQNALSIAQAGIKGALKSLKKSSSKAKKLVLKKKRKVITRKDTKKIHARKDQSKTRTSRGKSRKSTHHK
jgi:hypothetical protein